MIASDSIRALYPKIDSTVPSQVESLLLAHNVDKSQYHQGKKLLSHFKDVSDSLKDTFVVTDVIDLRPIKKDGPVFWEEKEEEEEVTPDPNKLGRIVLSYRSKDGSENTLTVPSQVYSNEVTGKQLIELTNCEHRDTYQERKLILNAV